ncbi:uncharacterized protein LOC122308091 [Carya illinoinensis]|uniref:Uncharacterized protein n=1 Tax=Carya illinoinensis TaxID=32201 RepID=A0A8T1QV55_CARIL|nr:uncharacterized protein LOC122308091 [Carya illinoinensis]XP_042977196.1 uncharacterized protein LOC122308091 [Carya illinoinensis]KAG6658052.1 hypothetical protein CIPAW_04G133300 [Carya illinoinensis]KAG6658053.1 hypothetical protein CIPAW_04G133300 [Carya illinoinensis]
MNLKNLMEDKQLDFYQPLLSVRRVPLAAASIQAENKRITDNSLPKIPPLPVYKSDLKSGPVSNPGTVPFLWEQIPGRPKDERKAQNVALERPHVTPRLPPGRVPKVKQQDSDKSSKPTSITQSKTENFLPRSQHVSFMDKNVTNYESCNEKMEFEGFGSEDGDEAYFDALDTISMTESFFMNCSTSGLSSLDGPDVKPSGTFSMDPQTRDIMIGRFLTAAKAMASETPQHATWKQPIIREQLRHLEKVAAGDKHDPLNQYMQNVVTCQSHNIDVEENEEEADGFDGSEISSSRICGLFPRFCLKNSFCLINPTPGMSMQRGVPISTVRSLRAKSSYSGFSESDKERARNAAPEQRSLDGHQSAELHKDKTELRIESKQTAHKKDCEKPDESPQNRRLHGNGILTCQNESSQSLHEEEVLGFSGKGENSRVGGSNFHRKGHKTFRELLANEDTKWESGSMSPMVEKTIYIDSVHTVKSRKSNSSSSDMQGSIDYRGDDFGITVKSTELEKRPSVDSSLKDFKYLSVVDEKTKVQPASSVSVDSCFLSSSARSNPDMQMEMRNDSKQSLDLIQDSSTLMSSKPIDTKKIDFKTQQPVKLGVPKGPHGLTQDSFTLTSLKVVNNKSIGLEIRHDKKSCTQVNAGFVQDSITVANSKVGGKKNFESRGPMSLGDQESSHSSYPNLPLSLPSPKSPSESWLKRTLPFISSRNVPSRSSLAMLLNTRNQASKSTSLESNWETRVKSSHTHHGHLRYSEELLTPIPEA